MSECRYLMILVGSKQTSQNHKNNDEQEKQQTMGLFSKQQQNRLVELVVYCWFAGCFTSVPICALISPASFIRVKELF